MITHEKADHHRDQPSQSVPLRASRRILVVDDFEESAQLLAGLLRKLGHEATAIDNPEAALEWISAHHPDAVLLDIAMPGLDGYEIARRLRAQYEPDDLLLVALTGYGQEQDRQRAFDAGFDVHLVKPASTEKLLKLFDELPTRTAIANPVTVS
jgi:CheY-like chemotaxis protein